MQSMIQTVNVTFFACTFLSAANATQVKFQSSCGVAEFSTLINKLQRDLIPCQTNDFLDLMNSIVP